MKLMGIGAFFSSKKSSFRMKKKKKKKSSQTVSPSFGTMSTASFSDDDSNTPKSVLHCNISYSSSISMGVPDLFGVYNRDGDDKITKRELEIVLRRLSPGDAPTAEELALMLAKIDGDGDGNISLEELGATRPTALVPPTAGSELLYAFSVFDADGDGWISAEELLGVFIALGDDGCTLDDCRRIIRGVDSDGDEYVCFDDFARMMGGQR